MIVVVGVGVGVGVSVGESPGVTVGVRVGVDVIVGVGVIVLVGVGVITIGVPLGVLQLTIQQPSASTIFIQKSDAVSYGAGKSKTYGGEEKVTT